MCKCQIITLYVILQRLTEEKSPVMRQLLSGWRKKDSKFTNFIIKVYLHFFLKKPAHKIETGLPGRRDSIGVVVKREEDYTCI